jgi:hypothetical protein
MSGDRKPDSATFERLIDRLSEAFPNDPRRAEWTQHVYRFDDVRAAAEILRSGRLVSRDRWVASGPQHGDAANREIIAQSEHAHRYARLYFRPRTPTQHAMEGIRRRQDVVRGAHCAVPVFLVFDAKRMLTRVGARFSDGNLAVFSAFQPQVGSTAAEFRNLPFRSIYHDSSLGQEEKQKILFHRNAEVLFEDQVDLDDLQEIVCRTSPERQTLLNLLGDHWKKYATLTRLERSGEMMFFKKDVTYVYDIQLESDRITVTMAPHVGPYEWEIDVRDTTEQRVLLHDTITRPAHDLPIEILISGLPEAVAVRLLVEGHLAFQGRLRRRTLIPRVSR